MMLATLMPMFTTSNAQSATGNDTHQSVASAVADFAMPYAMLQYMNL